MTLLSVRDLSLGIHNSVILRRVSVSIPAGGTLALVGESGSGKSLTALSIMRLLPHGSRASGSVDFAGRDLMTLDERTLCTVRGLQIGMIFQEPMTALNPVMTIGDQVAETLRIHGNDPPAAARAIASERLDRVGLPPDRFPRSLYPHQLSGGQRQRVCIAMAVAMRPKLLICDEPTTALDVSTQARILSLLRSLVADEGMALLLITHDLAVVAETADHVAVMHQGQVVESGPTRTVFRTLSHPYTRKLFAATSHTPSRKGIMGSALLKVRSIDRIYRLPRSRLLAPPSTFRAVRDVSFTLHSGESLGLVGESGCGKSTLTRVLLGLDPAASGRVFLDGDIITATAPVPHHVRRKVQAVFQDPFASFNPRHRVERLVAEPLHLNKKRLSGTERRKRVADALVRVGLDAADMEKFIHEFSGGQRQRIAIARALVLQPRLIVFDEAVSALDVSIRARILDLLADLQGSLGLTYLFISHDLSVVSAICDRVLVMKDGRIVEEGVPNDIFSNPTHSYTRSLLAAVPRIPSGWTPEATGARAPSAR
ncbi:MAG: ABC transporter ATP-binding protein [Rhodobacteraceae bacterium]|nr:ABC transporter ATP-binding protein [Paracoccaceae bacterium]